MHRSKRLSLKRASPVKIAEEPPSIRQLLAAHSAGSSEQEIVELALEPLLQFSRAEQGLALRVKGQELKVLSSHGFDTKTTKRLLNWNKGGARPGLQRWLLALYERVRAANPLLDTEPATTVPDELPVIGGLFACLLNERTLLALFNPAMLSKRGVKLLDPFLAVTEQLLREEEQHRANLGSMMNLSQALDRQGEGLLYVSFRSLSVKQVSASAAGLLGVEGNVVGEKLWHLFDKKKISLKELFSRLAKLQPDSPLTSGEEQEVKCWRVKHKEQELLVSFPGTATIGHSHCLILLIRKVDSYEKRVRDAEQKSKSKNEFMAHLGHEIRTPLNCLLSIAPLLANSSLNDEQKKFLQIIQQSSFDMMVIVGDFLDLARLDNQKMVLHESEIAVDELFDLIYRNMKPSAEAKHLEFTKRIDLSVPARIFADFGRLRQVIQNLVSNAIKFTRRGSLHMEIRAKHHSEYHRVSIMVQDTGIGIKKEDLQLIFKSFRQADESTTQEQGGLGLGLAISKKFMKLMDQGEIKVESEPGVGSTFTIEFNSPILDNELLLQKHKTLLSNKRVLIVDDTANNRISLFSQMEQWGLQPVTAPSSEDAINTSLIAKMSQPEPFDLAIIDLRMPSMDGVGLSNWIRRQGFTFPMVLLSSSPEESDNLTPEEKARFKYCLVRPVPQKKLLATVISALGSQDRTLDLILNPSPSNAPGGALMRGSLAANDRRGRGSRLPSEMRNTKLLVGEDTILNQRVMESLLRRIGYTSIDIVSNGQDVLSACQQPSAHYDAILMDIHMPIMNGFEASKQLTNIYSQRRLNRPKILAVTAMGANSEDVLEWCAKGYIDDVVGKPIEMGLLKERLDKLLAESDRLRRISTPM